MTSENELDGSFERFWEMEAGKYADKEAVKDLCAKVFFYAFSQKPPIVQLIAWTVHHLGGRVMQHEETQEYKIIIPFRKTDELQFAGEDIDLQRAFMEAIVQLPQEKSILKTKKAKKFLKKKRKKRENGEGFNIAGADGSSDEDE